MQLTQGWRQEIYLSTLSSGPVLQRWPARLPGRSRAGQGRACSNSEIWKCRRRQHTVIGATGWVWAVSRMGHKVLCIGMLLGLLSHTVASHKSRVEAVGEGPLLCVCVGLAQPSTPHPQTQALPHPVHPLIMHLPRGMHGLVMDSDLDASSQYPSPDGLATPETQLIAETNGVA
jgi:hypothetical protein